MEHYQYVCQHNPSRRDLLSPDMRHDITVYIFLYIISRRSITPQHIKYNSKSLDVVQSLYFGSKLPSSESTNKAIQMTQNFSLQTIKGNNIGLRNMSRVK